MSKTDPIPSDPSIDYIGTRLFEPQYRKKVVEHLCKSAYVASVIEAISIETHKKAPTSTKIEHIKTDLHKKKERIISEMVADMSSLTVLRGFAFTIRNILTRLYHLGIHVNDLEVERLRSTAKEAAQKKISLCFAPCHKSHVDYLVVSYVLYRMGIALPHIAAGDNLNMPFVGWVLRHNGAFFIRREWGGDKLYVAIMKEYIDYLILHGFNIEAFIEGTRSRTGKLLQPKFGFLKLVLESIMSNPGRDIIFVPVQLGYDKVIETPSYVNELLGTPKEKESIFQLFSSINVLQLKWGRIDVRFGAPFSLRSFIEAAELSGRIPPNISTSEKYGCILLPLGYRLLRDINQITSIMPAALVGTILLTLRGRGVGRNELIRKVKWLKDEIIMRGGKVAESGRSATEILVDRAVGVLRDLVGKRYDILESVYYPLRRFELSYYRNQVIHLFVPECIVSVAMYATIKVGGPVKNQRISIKSKLFSDVKFLSMLLRDEFVYEREGINHNLDKALKKLVSANVIVIGKDAQSGDLWVTLSAEERRTGRETFDFYCFLLWPFIESYWLACMSLYTILPDFKVNPDGLFWIDSRNFVSRSQLFGKTLYYEGDVSYFESISKETISNCLGWLKEQGIICLHKGADPPASSHYEPPHLSTNANTTWIALAKDWIPAEELPESNLLESKKNSSKREQKSEWDGPLGLFATEFLKPFYDDDSSIHLTRHRIDEAKQQDPYYDDDTSSIEDLDKLSKTYKRKVAISQDSDDHEKEFESWSQHRPKGRLWDLCERIGVFRREGKNRRDTSTVSIRVLRLAQLASQWNSGAKRKSSYKLKSSSKSSIQSAIPGPVQSSNEVVESPGKIAKL